MSGGTVAEALSITNTAPTGAFSEGVDSSFGTYTPGGGSTLTPTFAGSITNLAAGSTNNTSMTVSVNTTVAGMFGGNVIVHQASDGATTSGLGITALPDQSVGVAGTITGGVFNLAQPTVNNTQPISFGNVRIGSAVANQSISVSNTAPPGAFTELLDGSVVPPPPTGFTASGSFSGLVAGAAPNTSIQVGMNSGVAGAQSGNVVVNFVSDGTTIPGDGTTTNLGNTNVAVSGAVYRLANPTLNTTSVSLAARVGDATPSANVSVTNASPDQFTENLKASFETAPTGFTNTGDLGANGLAAQGADSTSLKVGLASTATSGTIAGSSTIDFVTTGAGTDNAPDMSVGSKMVSLTGNVYQTAAAAVTSSLSFGIVHVGDTVANQSVTVTNTATGALVDVITGGFGAAPAAPFTTSGDLGSGVMSGASSNALMVGLNTGTAGVFNGSEALMLASHDSQLADVALTAGPVMLSAQVNNFASLSILQEGGQGALSGGGDNFTLDFGDVVQGTTAPEALLALFNDNPLAEQAFTDLLSTSASLVSGSGFDFNGCSAKDLLGGTSQGGCDVSFETGALGNFTQTLSFDVESSNSSGYDQVIGDVTLTLEGDIVSSGPAVPEPSTWAMMLTGFAGLGALGWRRTIKVRTAA